MLGDADTLDAERMRRACTPGTRPCAKQQGRSREAMRESLVAIESAIAVDDPATEAQARLHLDWAYVSLGQSQLAVHSERALALYTELGDLSGQAVVLNNLGGFAYFDGRWDEAVELYERARVLRERTGNAVDAAVGLYNIGEVLIDQGHYDKAHECMIVADRVWRASDDRIGVGIAQMQLARLDAAHGAFDTALERFATARRAAGGVPCRRRRRGDGSADRGVPPRRR